MSRNRCETDCAWCGGTIVLEESPRLIRQEECGVHYYREYSGMHVANAHCFDCEAQYLAWVRWPSCTYAHHRNDDGRPFTDTSFRSTFNDEPGRPDFPKYAIKRGVIERIPWSDEVAKTQRYAGYWE